MLASPLAELRSTVMCRQRVQQGFLCVAVVAKQRLAADQPPGRAFHHALANVCLLEQTGQAPAAHRWLGRGLCGVSAAGGSASFLNELEEQTGTGGDHLSSSTATCLSRSSAQRSRVSSSLFGQASATLQQALSAVPESQCPLWSTLFCSRAGSCVHPWAHDRPDPHEGLQPVPYDLPGL